MKTKPVLFSGIQPSGLLHLGAYIGAIKNWIKLQNEYECFFSIVDLHSITVRQDPKAFRERCYDFLALYIACGIDPAENVIFCQSHVPAHAELTWILNCYTGMGELSRMTQFKDKAKKQEGATVSVGLFDYPVLQAADILLYRTNLVPVGADQKQHIELARDIALRFNRLYGEIFTVPDHFIPKAEAGARIMSLQDPESKMSKSDPNEHGTISLLDSPEVIRKKLKRAVTDSEAEVRFHATKPGVSNLLTIYAAVTGKDISALEAEYQGSGYGKFKDDLAEAVVTFVAPIQERYFELRHDKAALNAILQKGAEQARARAEQMLQKVYEAVGFVVLK
ncbi:MAG: tryptophan--tRNA ligase [Gammaproteobacteria bacterium]|nr:tryptophan--tRNA ligase [Gammaproteobacteria bacterium]